MTRIVLIHFHADEAESRLAQLRAGGYQAELMAGQGGDQARALRTAPPDLVIIDLSRRPSHGREIASFLRRSKPTRQVPLLFLDGAADKVARTRQLLPDATYDSWRRFRSAVKRALRDPPRDPVVRDTMAAYSGTPLPRKLGIKPAMRLVLLRAPEGFLELLGELPADVKLGRRAQGSAELVILFVRTQRELADRFAAAVKTMATGGGLWIAWPKQASPLHRDLTQAQVRAFGLERGLVDYKICAIDADWSGLKFSRR